MNKEVTIIDIAVPGDSRVKEKELEKMEKYQYLREEIGHVWQMRNATVVPVVIGALGVISDKFEKHIKKLRVKIATDAIQKQHCLAQLGYCEKFYLFRDHKKGTLRPIVTCSHPFLKNNI